jgi:hypothetical protein
MVQSERCQDLEEDETERVTDALPDWGIFLAGLAGEVGTLGKADDSLTDYVRLGGAREGTKITLTSRRLVMRETSEMRHKAPALHQNQKTLSLAVRVRLVFFLSVFSLHSFSCCWR